MIQGDLRKVAGISTTSLMKLKKGQNFTTNVILKICKALGCDISNIMEIKESSETNRISEGKE